MYLRDHGPRRERARNQRRTSLMKSSDSCTNRLAHTTPCPRSLENHRASCGSTETLDCATQNRAWQRSALRSRQIKTTNYEICKIDRIQRMTRKPNMSGPATEPAGGRTHPNELVRLSHKKTASRCVARIFCHEFSAFHFAHINRGSNGIFVSRPKQLIKPKVPKPILVVIP